MAYPAVIIGYGEVGKAIEKLYLNQEEQCRVYDTAIKTAADLRDLTQFPAKASVLHICFPYKDESFIKHVRAYITRFKPTLTIVHSTVAIGTTRKIQGKRKYDVVHSPMRGMHPDLYSSLLTFTPLIGADSYRAAAKAKKFCRRRLPTTAIILKGGSRTSEALKLWDTLIYGLNIIAAKEMQLFCNLNDCNYDEVMSVAAKTYNAGYAALNKPQFCRYDIKHMPGPIGGHCIIPNAKILLDNVPNAVSEFVLTENAKYKQITRNLHYAKLFRLHV